MKYPTVSALCEGVAGAIREKEGSTALINPQDFVDRIKGLEVGGGESGGSEYEYFALTDGWSNDLGFTFSMFSSLVKTETSKLGMAILPPQYAQLANDGYGIDPIAIAIDMSSLIVRGVGQKITIKEEILGSGTTEESLAKYRITKEQFYDLNTLLSE